MISIEWNATKKDVLLIHRIAKRVADLCKKDGRKLDLMSLEMDITACHLNGCPLKLSKLLKADEFNLLHDVAGISKHINRETGKLENCFLPRFAI